MSVISKATAQANADTIKNETGANLNTASRVGQLFRDLADSLAWVAFGASGVSHAIGLVPDPGSVAGTAKFLCEDGSWKIPAGGFTAPATPGDDNKVGYAVAGAIGWASAIKTDGTFLSIGASPATVGLTRYPHNPGVALIAGLSADGLSTYSILQWGAGANNKIQLGQQTVPFLEVKAIGLSFSAASQTSGSQVGYTVTAGAHTGLTASTEVIDANFNLGQTKQWATGALTTQRAMRIVAPTYGFVGASTITMAATLAISGAPAAGTNATITNALALWIESGGIGLGSSIATTGLIRTATAPGVVLGYLAFDGTSAAALRIDGDASTFNDIALGFNDATHGNNSLYLSAKAQVVIRLATASKFEVHATATNLKDNYVQMTAISAPSAPGSTDIAFFNEGGIFKVRNASRTVVLDFPTIAKGTDLTDADQTKNRSDGGRFVIPPASRTASRTTTLGTSGAPIVGQAIWIECEDVTANTKLIANGGASGGTIWTIAGSTKQAVSCVWDGNDWQRGIAIDLS